MWFISSRRHREELAAARAETARVRAQRDNALALRDTAEFNREQILRQLAGQEAANVRLHGRILELGRRISALSESDPEYAAALERRVARLRKVVVRVAVAGHAEKLRADHLQGRLDAAAREIADGEWRGRARRAEKRVAHLEKELDNACGMPPGGLLDSAPWQPGYKAERDKQVSP